MASIAILDRLKCALNQWVAFSKKVEKLTEIKNLCEEALSADFEAKRGIEREVLICNFAHLQFPVSQQLHASNHSPVR